MKGNSLHRGGKVQGDIESKCGSLGSVSAELLPPLGQSEEHRQQVPDPRRRKACPEWSRDLLWRNTVSLKQPLGVGGKVMHSLTSFSFLF